MNSAAATKVFVLRAVEALIRSVSEHLSQDYHLSRETRENIAAHYEKLLKDMENGICKFATKILVLNIFMVLVRSIIPLPFRITHLMVLSIKLCYGIHPE